MSDNELVTFVCGDRVLKMTKHDLAANELDRHLTGNAFFSVDAEGNAVRLDPSTIQIKYPAKKCTG